MDGSGPSPKHDDSHDGYTVTVSSSWHVATQRAMVPKAPPVLASGYELLRAASTDAWLWGCSRLTRSLTWTSRTPTRSLPALLLCPAPRLLQSPPPSSSPLLHSFCIPPPSLRLCLLWRLRACREREGGREGGKGRGTGATDAEKGMLGQHKAREGEVGRQWQGAAETAHVGEGEEWSGD
eukprot:2473030-Rhodomonas_salina.1